MKKVEKENSKKKIAVTVQDLYITYRGLKKTSIRASWSKMKSRVELFPALKGINFELEEGKILGIVGRNGSGKSTLLKLIVGELVPLMGDIVFNDKVDIGYYAQEHELLDNDKIILDNFSEFDLSISELRAFLGSFLFTGDDVYKKVSYLSPGERSRVALAKLALTGANFLILDEPTTALDPKIRKTVWNIILKLNQEKKNDCTFLYNLIKLL